MNALAVGLLAAVPAVLLHAALLRFWPARLRFLVLPALVLGMLGLLAATGPAATAEAWMVGAILALSLTVAQMLLLVGVVYDSPTLAIANAIMACGDAGLDAAGVAELPARMPFVTSRLSALVAGGTLRAEGQALVMTAQAPAALRLGALYRSLRRGQAEAG